MKLLISLLAFITTSMMAAPNVILMMGDDHGWEETGYHGHPHVKTPVLDDMAASGLRMDAFHAAHPSCSPTRASFLTGRHPNRMGTFAPGWSLRPEEISVGHVMTKAGYRCAHFGKWHVGAVKAGSPVNPGAMGFHTWLSHDNFFELNPSLSRDGGPPQVFEGESSEILVREAIQFIDSAKKSNKPFFTIIWFGSPHEPYSGLPQDLALYDDLPAKYTQKVKLTSNETGGQTQRPQGEVLRERYAEITAMDRSIGTLRTHLKQSGLRDDTLLFYCGDNGTSPESAIATPHRGSKGVMYQGGTLVPGLIEWPARIKTPRTTNVRAVTSDLLPTLAALTDQPMPQRPLDGINLIPLLDGTMTERAQPIHFWAYNTARLKGTKNKPYIDPELQKGTTPLAKKSGGKTTRDFINFKQPQPPTEADYQGPRAIIDGDFKLVIHEQNNDQLKRELFDLKTDPAEKTNLIKTDPKTAMKLQNQLYDWQHSVLKSLSSADYTK